MISLYDQLPFLGGADLMEEIENAPVDLEEKNDLKSIRNLREEQTQRLLKKSMDINARFVILILKESMAS
jgi:hypothetical protein